MMSVVSTVPEKAMVALILLVLFNIGATTTIQAQVLDANDPYPDAPVADTLHARAIIKAPVQALRAAKRRWLTQNSLSIATLVAGEAIDSWGTYRNMTHTKWICGNSAAFAPGY